MQKVSQDLLRDLDANRAAYTKDPQKLRALVDRHLLPNFDVDYAARLVLGQHWRTATEAQRKRFVDAFYQSLMRNYGDAIVEFTADRLTILPFKGDLAARHGDRAHRGQAQQRHAGAGQLQPARDAARAGRPGTSRSKASPTSRITAPTSAREIAQKGIDAVIQRLEAQNARASRTRA